MKFIPDAKRRDGRRLHRRHRLARWAAVLAFGFAPAAAQEDVLLRLSPPAGAGGAAVTVGVDCAVAAVHNLQINGGGGDPAENFTVGGAIRPCVRLFELIFAEGESEQALDVSPAAGRAIELFLVAPADSDLVRIDASRRYLSIAGGLVARIAPPANQALIEGTAARAVTVAFSAAARFSGGAVTMTIGGAAAPGDYVLSAADGAQIVPGADGLFAPPFPVNGYAAVFSVAAVRDLAAENDEALSFEVVDSRAAGFTAGGAAATFTVVTPRIGFTAGSAAAAADFPVFVTLTLTPPPTAAISVTLVKNDAETTAADDDWAFADESCASESAANQCIVSIAAAAASGEVVIYIDADAAGTAVKLAVLDLAGAAPADYRFPAAPVFTVGIRPSANINAQDSDGRTALARAVRDHKAAEVAALLAAGADPAIADNQGQTPLHWAVWSGRAEVMNALLADGAAATVTTNNGVTPLHWAGRYDRAALIAPLIAAGGDLHSADSNGWTPLHYAVGFGSFGPNVDALRALLAQGADPAIKNALGLTPLYYATTDGDRDRTNAIPVLLDGGAYYDVELAANIAGVVAGAAVGLTLALPATTPGVLPLTLIRADDTDAADGDWSFAPASCQSIVSNRRCIIGVPALSTVYAVTLNIAAGAAGAAPKAVVLTLQGPAPADHRYVGDLRFTASIAPAGLNAGAFDQDGLTALHRAARAGDAALIAALAASGADVEVATNENPPQDLRLPLHYAAETGGAAAVRALLDAGADVNSIDRFSRTGLHWAVIGGNAGAAAALVAGGADIALRSKESSDHLRPIHRAAALGEVEVMQVLIAAGADINAETREPYETPLHRAAHYGQVEAIEALAAAGANISPLTFDFGTREEYSPLDYANRNNQPEAAAVLRLLRGRCLSECRSGDINYDGEAVP